MKNILIAGGAGFIGSHLCDYFVQQEYRVFCVDNQITGSTKNIKHLLDQKSESRFEFIEQDITKPFSFPESLEAILHLASPASPVDYQQRPVETLLAGSLGTYHLLELARDKNATILLASTSEVYGDPLEHPQRESYWGNVNPIGPRSSYDEAKRYMEALTVAYHQTHRLNIRIARIFNTYGPRMRLNDGRVIPSFFSQALLGENLTVYGQGLQTRSFCYIEDLVAGLVKLLHSTFPFPVNLGNPQELSIHELAEKVIALTGSRSRVSYKTLPVNDPQVRCPDITLAQRVLNWSPQIPLEEGLKRTLHYFKQMVQ